MVDKKMFTSEISERAVELNIEENSFGANLLLTLKCPRGGGGR